MNARARENEDHIVYGPTHSRPNRPRSYLGIDLIVSCSLSLSLSRAGRWNRENCHCHGRPSTMTTSAKREAKKKTLRSPCLRPSVADRDAKAEKDRARARTHERTDGRRAGGRDTQVAHIVHSRPAVQRAQRRRGPPRKGAGARDHDGITAPRIRARASEHVSGRRDAGVGSGRVADIAVKSDTRVGSATSVRPSASVRPSVGSFPHASYSCEWRAAPSATVEEEEEEEDRRPGSCHRRHAPTLTRPSPDDNKCRARTATRGRDRDRRRRRRPSVVVIYDQKLRRGGGNARAPSVRPSAVGSQQWQRMRSELLIE